MRSLLPVFGTFLALVLSVAASISIVHPTAGQTIHSGKNFTVMVAQTDTPTSRYDVAVAIGFKLCAKRPAACQEVSVDNGIGEPLLITPYAPEFHPGFNEVYQNFSVALPKGDSGRVVLGVAHFFLIGAESIPLVEVANVTLKVV